MVSISDGQLTKLKYFQLEMTCVIIVNKSKNN